MLLTINRFPPNPIRAPSKLFTRRCNTGGIAAATLGESWCNTGGIAATTPGESWCNTGGIAAATLGESWCNTGGIAAVTVGDSWCNTGGIAAATLGESCSNTGGIAATTLGESWCNTGGSATTNEPMRLKQILFIRARVRWNVCTLSENNMRSEVCWFEADRRLKTAAHRDLLELSLSQGEWYVRVTRDALGMVRGLVMDNVAPFREIPTLPTWSPCTASETPSARALQQTASRTLLDAPLDPLLRVESAPAQRLGLSGLHSESSGQDVPAPSKDTGEGAWTAVPDGLLVLVGGEDAHHPLSYSSPAGDCKRICERSAPCGGFSYNDTSASSPSSPPPSCVFTTCLAPGARWVRSR
eukprot:gene1809-biopygen1687